MVFLFLLQILLHVDVCCSRSLAISKHEYVIIHTYIQTYIFMLASQYLSYICRIACLCVLSVTANQLSWIHQSVRPTVCLEWLSPNSCVPLQLVPHVASSCALLHTALLYLFTYRSISEGDPFHLLPAIDPYSLGNSCWVSASMRSLFYGFYDVVIPHPSEEFVCFFIIPLYCFLSFAYLWRHFIVLLQKIFSLYFYSFLSLYEIFGRFFNVFFLVQSAL